MFQYNLIAFKIIFCFSWMTLCFSPSALGQATQKAGKGQSLHAKEKDKKNNSGDVKAAKDVSPAKPAPGQTSDTTTKIDGSKTEDQYTGVSSTHLDFTEGAIDGQMKAPEGFMLQGHQSSSLSQMVKLRSHFRNELNNSKSATKALVR